MYSFDRNDEFLVGGTANGQIIDIDMSENGKQRLILQAHTAPVLSMLHEKNRGFLYTSAAGSDPCIKIWKHSIENQGKPYSLAILLVVSLASPPRQFAVTSGPRIAQDAVVAVATCTNSVEIYNVTSDFTKFEKLLDHAFDENHVGAITSISGNSNLNIFVTTSSDCTAKLWDGLDNSLMREVQFLDNAWSAGFANARGDLFVGLDTELVLIRVQDYLPYHPLRYLMDLDFEDDKPDMSLQFDPGLDFWEYYRGSLEEKDEVIKWHVAKKVASQPVKNQNSTKSIQEKERNRQLVRSKRAKNQYLEKEKRLFKLARPFEKTTLYSEAAMSAPSDKKDSESSSSEEYAGHDDGEGEEKDFDSGPEIPQDLLSGFSRDTSSKIRKEMIGSLRRTKKRRAPKVQFSLENVLEAEFEEEPEDPDEIPKYVPPKTMTPEEEKRKLGKRKSNRVLKSKRAKLGQSGTTDESLEENYSGPDEESSVEGEEEESSEISEREIMSASSETVEERQARYAALQAAKGEMSKRLAERIKKTKEKLFFPPQEENIMETEDILGIIPPPNTSETFRAGTEASRHSEQMQEDLAFSEESVTVEDKKALRKLARSKKKPSKKNKKKKKEKKKYVLPVTMPEAERNTQLESPEALVAYESLKESTRKKIKKAKKIREQAEKESPHLLRRDSESREQRIKKRLVPLKKDDGARRSEGVNLKANPWKKPAAFQIELPKNNGSTRLKDSVETPTKDHQNEPFPDTFLPQISSIPAMDNNAVSFEFKNIDKKPLRNEAQEKRIRDDKKTWSLLQGVFDVKTRLSNEDISNKPSRKTADSVKLQEELMDLNKRSWFPEIDPASAIDLQMIVRVLFQVLKNGHSKEKIEASGTLHLYSHIKIKGAIMYFYNTFKDDFVGELSVMNAVINPLLEFLEDESPEVRTFICKILPKFTFFNESVIVTLLSKIRDRDKSVRVAAQGALEEFGIGNKRQLYEVMKGIDLLERTDELDNKYGNWQKGLSQNGFCYLDELLAMKIKAENSRKTNIGKLCAEWTSKTSEFYQRESSDKSHNADVVLLPPLNLPVRVFSMPAQSQSNLTQAVRLLEPSNPPGNRKSIKYGSQSKARRGSVPQPMYDQHRPSIVKTRSQRSLGAMTPTSEHSHAVLDCIGPY